MGVEFIFLGLALIPIMCGVFYTYIESVKGDYRLKMVKEKERNEKLMAERIEEEKRKNEKLMAEKVRCEIMRRNKDNCVCMCDSCCCKESVKPICGGITKRVEMDKIGRVEIQEMIEYMKHYFNEELAPVVSYEIGNIFYKSISTIECKLSYNIYNYTYSDVKRMIEDEKCYLHNNSKLCIHDSTLIYILYDLILSDIRKKEKRIMERYIRD